MVLKQPPSHRVIPCFDLLISCYDALIYTHTLLREIHAIAISMENPGAVRMPGQMPSLQQGGPSYTYLLFLAMLFFLMSGGGNNDPTADARLERAITRRTTELDRFNDFVHANASLPSTNNETLSWNNTFELGQWKEETIVQPLVDSILHSDPSSVYWRNVSGFLNGQYEALNVSLPTAMDKKKLQSKRGVFPWEIATPAKVYLKLKDLSPSDGADQVLDDHVSFVQGGIELRSSDDEVETSLDLQGLQCVFELIWSFQPCSFSDVQLPRQWFFLCAQSNSPFVIVSADLYADRCLQFLVNSH